MKEPEKNKKKNKTSYLFIVHTTKKFNCGTRIFLF